MRTMHASSHIPQGLRSITHRLDCRGMCLRHRCSSAVGILLARDFTPHGLRSNTCRLDCGGMPVRHRCSSAVQSTHILTGRDFAGLASEAIKTGSVLDLAQSRVELHEPFKLGSDEVLRITGGTIVGDGHSIFQVQTSRKGLLELRECELQHLPCLERSTQSSLGAALFARGKARVALHGCSISSQAGFGVWLVQKAWVELHGCTLPRSGRSSIVAFENARLDVCDSLLSDGTPHAICARGDARVRVRATRIERAEVRAIYIYHSAQLDVHSSTISGSRHAEVAAIQVDSLRPGDEGQVTLAACNIFADNAGGDLSVTGNVKRYVDGEVDARVATDFGVFSWRSRY